MLVPACGDVARPNIFCLHLAFCCAWWMFPHLWDKEKAQFPAHGQNRKAPCSWLLWNTFYSLWPIHMERMAAYYVWLLHPCRAQCKKCDCCQNIQLLPAYFFRGSPCTALASSTCVACTCCHDLFLPRQELNFSFPPEFLLHLQAGKLAWCWLLFTTRTYLTIFPKKGSLKKSQALEIENQRWQMKRCDSWKPRQIDFHLVFVKIWHPFFIFIFGWNYYKLPGFMKIKMNTKYL